MEFLPDLNLTWISGGLFLIGLVLTEGILFRLFPKDVVARLFDRVPGGRKNRYLQ